MKKYWTHWYLPHWAVENKGVLPMRNENDIGATGTLLSEVQQSIFNNASAPVFFDEKTSSEDKNFLGGMRYLSGDVQPFQSRSMVSCEKWDDNGNVEIHFDSSMCELHLGYGIRQFLSFKKARGLKSFDHLLLKEPLCLWASIWNDLSKQEKLIYLTLEKELQQNKPWLHFDGVFGVSLAKLFDGIAWKPGKKYQSQADFIHYMLKKLGNKLIDHGFLKYDGEQRYLAIGEDSDPQLCLQLSDMRLNDSGAYRSQCFECLEKLFYTHHKEYLSLLLRNLSHLDTISEIGDFWESVKTDCWVGSGAVCDSALALYIELHIRQLPDHEDPLPEKVLASEIIGMCKPSPDEASFRNFERVCWSESDVLLQLLDEPGCRADFKNVKRQPEVQRVIQTEAKSGNTINLKKLAAEELESLSKENSKEYETIKSQYLGSLKDNKKQLLLDLRQRMQPEMFENHLKHSLIRFMVENPSVWKSAKSQKRQHI